MWWRRIVVMSAAIAITVVGLGFWTYFAKVLGHYLSAPDQPQQVTQPTNPNEVTVKIINQPLSPAPQCTKAHPCPAQPHE